MWMSECETVDAETDAQMCLMSAFLVISVTLYILKRIIFLL